MKTPSVVSGYILNNETLKDFTLSTLTTVSPPPQYLGILTSKGTVIMSSTLSGLYKDLMR